MPEPAPLFKFKKREAKKIGDFDALDASEWTLLVKPQIQDVTLFVHFHKLWNVIEIPGVEADPDNGIEEVKEIKAHPAWEHNTGFIKEGKFIVTQQRTVSEQTYHAIHKRYVHALEQYIGEGYSKDFNNYLADTPKVPHYYINERMSQEDAQLKAMQNMLRNQNTGIPGATQINSVIPVGSPKVKNIKTGLFKALKKALPNTTTNP